MKYLQYKNKMECYKKKMILEELNTYYPLNEKIDDDHQMFMKIVTLGTSDYITVKCTIQNIHNKKSKVFGHWTILYKIDEEHWEMKNLVRKTHWHLQNIAANLKKALKIIDALRHET